MSRSVEGPAINGTKASEVGADGVKLFSRKQAANALQVGHNTLIWWHSLGRLVPALTRNGVHLYTAEQLAEWRRGNPEAVAAQAFKLFEEGQTSIAVVIALHAEPSTIEKLFEQYVRMSAGWLIAGPHGSRSAWERTYHLGKLTPQKLRTALELCASNDELRAKLLAID